MKTGVVLFSRIRGTPGLVLAAERYWLTDEECRQKLLAHVQARLDPLVAERAAIETANSVELRRRYAGRFWHLKRT